jgi:hypothetical protein
LLKKTKTSNKRETHDALLQRLVMPFTESKTEGTTGSSKQGSTFAGEAAAAQPVW